MACNMFETAQQLVRDGIRHQFPGIGPVELRVKYFFQDVWHRFE